MTADHLLDELANRGWLAEPVLNRVRQKVGGRGIEPDSVARFLVDKGHLKQEQADELLAAIGAVAEPLVEPIDSRQVRGDDMPAPEPSGVDLGAALASEALGGDSGTEGNDTSSEASGADPKSSKKAKEKKRREKRRQQAKGKNEWDSPLMLIGSGVLVLLLLCGFAVYYLLLRGSGDDLLKAAQASFDEDSYSQAIGQYENFMEDFPSHEGSDLARVYLGLARIRQSLEVSNDFEGALERSEQEIPAMIQTSEVELAQSDLSALLPRIASGLVDKADNAEVLSDINRYVGLTNKALDLNLNNKYVPSQKRNRPELERVEEVLSRISRRQESLQALEDTLGAMQSAVNSGDVRPAYEAHAELVKEHPELANKPELIEAIASAVAAEQGGIRFVEEPIAAQTSEPDSPITSVVATVDQRRPGAAPINGAVAFQFQGVAYGFNTGDGALLWRRSLGGGIAGIAPLIADDGCLLIDARRQELVRVELQTGELVWRVALKDDLLQPVLLGDQVLVPSRAGRLHIVNARSGRRDGYLQFAQPLASAPVVDEEGKWFYLVGEHSSVYSLSADNWECRGVYYLGHSKGSVVAPPAAVLGRVLVVENNGLASSTLHTLALDDQGVIEGVADKLKVQGLSSGAPVVFGRRLAMVSDSGQIKVFEVSPEDATAPLTELAARRPPRRAPTQRYSALVNRHFWVAGRGLAKYSIAPAGNRLPVADVQDRFRDDLFTSPLIVRGDVLLHARRRRGQPGLTVGATDAKTGAAYWETDVAVPPAGPPSASLDGDQLIQTSATGRVFPIRSGAVGRAIATSGPPTPAPTDQLLQTTASNSNAALSAAIGSEWILRTTGSGGADWSQLPDRLACAPTPFAGGWLTTLSIGQVFLVNADRTAPEAVPCQPEIMSGKPRRWRPAGVGNVRGEPTAVLTDADHLYALQLFDGAPPRLEVISQIEVEPRATTRVAIAAEQAIVGHVDGSLTVHDAESLDPIAATEPGSPIAWGPFAIDSRVLVATAAGELVCYDLSTIPSEQLTPAWRQTLPVGTLVDAPLRRDEDVVLAMRSGIVCSVSLETGRIEPRRLDETLASAPMTIDSRLALATADGSVLFVDNRP